jgi:NAD(P)-dependent dehydrogenase (short-subunit alcohol dehydrogenase family)
MMPQPAGSLRSRGRCAWGRADILVNNAGILIDRSFAKMDLASFRSVIDVHLMGAVICTKAVRAVMRAQQHGRVVMTASSSGRYGNFGQANYAAAKMVLVGLMQVLAQRLDHTPFKVGHVISAHVQPGTVGRLSGGKSSIFVCLGACVTRPEAVVLRPSDQAIASAPAGKIIGQPGSVAARKTALATSCDVVTSPLPARCCIAAIVC